MSFSSGCLAASTTLSSISALPTYVAAGEETGQPASKTLRVLCPEVDRDEDGFPDGLLFSTGPFNCTATIRPPEPRVTGDCWNWEWTFELWAERADPASGELVYRQIATATDHIVKEIPPGLYDIHYIVEDFCGNTQRQECTLRVIDELGQTCKARNATIRCTQLDFDPLDQNQVAQRFGTPQDVLQLEAACGVTIDEEIRWNPANCNTGLMERHFTVNTPAGVSSSCMQTIRIEPRIHYQVRFPADVEVQDCRTDETEIPAANVFGCDLLAVTQDTTALTATTTDACYQLAVKHQVINWCEYDGEADAAPLVLRSLTELDKRRRAPLELEVNYDDPEGVVLRLFEASETGVKVLETFSMPAYRKWTRGLFEYTQLLEIYDHTPPQVDHGSSRQRFCLYGPTAAGTCEATVSFTFSTFDNCSPEAVDLTASRLWLYADPAQEMDPAAGIYSVESLGKIFLVSGRLPLGSHRFVWTLTDACGNTADRYFDVVVEDCQAPRPRCLENQVVELLPADLDEDGIVESGANTVWARDLLQSIPPDCSTPLSYSINRVGVVADREQHSLTFTCDDPVARPIPVELHAWDAAGNHDFCELIIVLEDQQYLCTPPDGGQSLAGTVTTEKGQPVAGVELQLSGPRSQTIRNESNGAYLFQGLQSGYDYTVRPWMNEDILNGVSTYDLVLISQHILAREVLQSPYQLIAADLNNSGTVTTLDLVELRRLVLNVETGFRNNTSWRFIDASYVFPNPADPWIEPFPEVINVNNLEADQTGLDFIAVKIGDVSGNARASDLLASVGFRDGPKVQPLYVEPILFEPGRMQEVPVFISDAEKWLGCQFTLEWNQELVDEIEIRSRWIEEEEVAFFPEEGKFTLSWIKNIGLSDRPEQPLPFFIMKIQSRKPVSVDRIIRLSPEPVRAEIYGVDGRANPLELAFFPSKKANDPLVLEQNRPNPFRNHTLIGFKILEAGPVELTLRDANGRVMYRRAAYLPAGYEEWKIDRRELPAAGVYYYTLESGAGRATKSLVVLPD